MKRLVWAALVFVCGCGTPNAQGGATAPSGFHTDAADLGNGQWFITCLASASGCTWRAQNLCPTGYDVLNINQAHTPVGYVGPYGGGIGSRQDFNLTDKCK